MREAITMDEVEDISQIKQLIQLFKSAKKTQSPFLLIRYPNQPISLASKKTHSKCSFTFAPFHEGETISLTDFELLNVQKLDSYIPCSSVEAVSKVSKKYVLTVDCQLFIDNVISAKTEIEKGTFKKVVLSKAKCFDGELQPIRTFWSLEKKYDSALVHCFYHPHCGTWIGASPEKLLEKDKAEQYHIHSLAGTKNVNEDWTEKEITEQKIVTDYITSKLSENGATEFDIEGPMDYEYGEIKHLKSSIHFHSEKEVEQIVNVIHPTPAVCGMPLHPAKQFILDHEGYDRSYYTGFIGLKNLKNIHDTYFVNLRCMQVNDDNAYIYTGAGIVADSDPEKEWEEVEAKAKTLIDCIETNG